MKFSLKLISLSVISTLSLTGCLEVDDDSNKDLVDSLNQQNAILTEQNELLSNQNQAEKTVTVSGSVFEIVSFTPVTTNTATLEIFQGDELLMTSATDESGDFTIEGLPAASDLTLLVSFADNQFMQRAFFITTPSVTDTDVFDDIGYLQVSEPVTVTFSLKDSASGEPLSGLNFWGYSHGGLSNSRAYDYAHFASFDESTGLYSVTLPKGIDVTLSALIDSDGDNQRDFEIDTSEGIQAYTSGTNLVITSANTIQGTGEVSLSEPDEVVEVFKNIYITLLDKNGEPLEGAEFNSQNLGISATYNPETQQYELTLPYDGNVNFTMPSLIVGDITYSSGSVTIYDRVDSRTGETTLWFSGSGYSSNDWYAIADTSEINLILVGNEISAYSDLEVVAKFLSSDDYVNTVYYSEPVEVAEQDVSLTYNEVEVVFGNDSFADGIPDGFTNLESVEREVPLEINLDSNDVKLTVTPQSELASNTNYTYTVSGVAAQSDEIIVDLAGDDTNFTTAIDVENNIFDINDVFVDNNNYYSNGTIIVSENTAGTPSERTEYQSQPYVYFPTTIETLNYLVLRLITYTRNNSEYTSTQSYDVVVDGELSYSTRSMFGLVVADNETVSNNAFNYSTYLASGSTLETGRYAYRVSTGSYSMADNKAGSLNNLTFNYEYQTKQGVTESGTITLPVR